MAAPRQENSHPHKTNATTAPVPPLYHRPTQKETAFMTNEEKIDLIRPMWRAIYPADKHGGIICPLCGSGNGANGTGISENPKARKPHSLKCFVCDFSGDLIDLYMQEKKIPYLQALTDLCDRLTIHDGDTLPVKRGSEWRRVAYPKNSLLPYYHECQERITDAAAYLESRHISLATAKKFRLGFDPSADPAGKGHPAPRIIIPVTEDHYATRRIDGVAEYAKMDNSCPEKGILNSSALYDSNAVFVTEGPFDAMAISECGGDAIALCSTSGANKLLNKLKNRPTEATLILALDNDEAGKRATKLLAEGLANLNTKYVLFDYLGKDPSDFLALNPIECKKRVNSAATKVIEQNKAPAIEEAQQKAEEAVQDEIYSFLANVASEAYKPLETGFKPFDGLLEGGIVRQQLTILMAAPGSGKTTLCQNIAESLADHGHKVLFYNLEMSRDQMLAKALSYRLAKRNLFYKTGDILAGYKWTEKQYDEITAAAKAYMTGAHRYIRYNPEGVGNDLNQILAHMEKEAEAAARNGEQAPIVFIDYLHLLTVKENGRTPEVAEVIKTAVTRLKEYAVRRNTAVICIAATNREATKSGRVNLSSGRDSSNVEYTADNSISLNYYEIDEGTADAENPADMDRLQSEEFRRVKLRVLKARFSQPGKTENLYFNAAYNTFYSDIDEGARIRGAKPFSTGIKVDGSVQRKRI